jgi:hypothetical protein
MLDLLLSSVGFFVLVFALVFLRLGLFVPVSFSSLVPMFTSLEFLAQNRSHISVPVTPVTTMESSHCREIHYHLARALMHLNSIAGFLPFFEPAADWEDHEADLYRRASLSNRHLHTFVPLPSSPAIPSLASHGGILAHMVLNPEPNLRPLSIRRGPYPIEETRPVSASNAASARAESSNPARLPAESSVGTPQRLTLNGSHADLSKQRNWAIPETMKRQPVQRKSNENFNSTPALPIIRDLPPEAPTSDDSDVERRRRLSPSDNRQAPPAAANPSAPATVPPRPSPSLERAVTVSSPAEAPPNPVVPPRSSVNHHLRPWTGAEDHELVTFKSDARARPAWKTIGFRLKRDPEACKACWLVLRQNMPGLNPRTEPEAEGSGGLINSAEQEAKQPASFSCHVPSFSLFTPLVKLNVLFALFLSFPAWLNFLMYLIRQGPQSFPFP